MNKVIPEKDVLLKLYSLGYSMKDIADSLQMSIGKIHKYFVIYEIKPRKHLNKLAKEKISNANKNNSYRKGKLASSETKEKISISRSKGIGSKSISNTGYIRMYFPDHPKSDKWGYIFEHDLIMELLTNGVIL